MASLLIFFDVNVGGQSILPKIDAVFCWNIMQNIITSLAEIPQEIVHEILTFVPEYGHGVSRELHEQSLDVDPVSAYCDFYRYCARLQMDPLGACLTILDSGHLEDLRGPAMNYVGKNKMELLFRYLKQDIKWIKSNVLADLGFANADNWTIILEDNYDVFIGETEPIYKNMDYYGRVLNLYASMILRENGFMSKKEFDSECSLVEDLDTVLEIILAVYTQYDHIVSICIRYFRARMPAIINSIKDQRALKDGIIYDNVYYDNNYAEIMERLNGPVIRTGIDANVDLEVLRKIRDQLIGKMRYDNWRDSKDLRMLLSMIESLADEE